MNLTPNIRLFTFSILIVLLAGGCSKEYHVCESADEEDSRWPWNITAEWNQQSVNFDFRITSDSDQLAVDFLAPSDETIEATLSDGGNSELNFLQSSSGDTNKLFVRNQSIFDESYPMHELIIIYFDAADSGAAVYSISENESESSEDYTGMVYFTFNSLDYSLSLSSQSLYNLDSTKSVTLNGSVNMETTQLIAENSISVPLSSDQTTTTIILNPSGEYFRLTDDGSGVPDEAQGTWEVTDTTAKTISIIETYEDWESGETVTDTLSISYTFETDFLTFSQEKDPCAGYTDNSECFEQFELNFGLSENSITALSLTSTMIFTKASSGKQRQITGSQPAYWFGKTTYFKDLYLK